MAKQIPVSKAVTNPPQFRAPPPRSRRFSCLERRQAESKNPSDRKTQRKVSTAFIEKRPQTVTHLQKATGTAGQKLSAELLLGRGGKKVKLVLFWASPENRVSHTSLNPSQKRCPLNNS